MLFDGGALFGFARFALQNAQDAVGVAHAGDFGVGGNDGFVGEVERHQRALLDAGGRVAHHIFEAELAGEFVEHALDAFFVERVFVAGLRCG